MRDEAVTDNLASYESHGAQAPDHGLSQLRYREIAEEVRRQPPWRRMADKCADYYDGNQITPEEAQLLQERGLGELIANRVKPTINSMLGLEAKTRTDWRVAADHDRDVDVAEAMTAKLMEAERESRADVACSDAFKEQMIAGLGWVYVGRNSNPFDYRYLVENVHRNECFWDWSARKPDLSDGRYFVRQRWYPIEQVAAYFPAQAGLIRAVGSGWSPEWMDLARQSETLLHAFNQEHSGEWMEFEWRNIEARLVMLREVWYRHFVRGLTLDLPDGRTVEFDLKNPVHVAAVGTGRAMPRQSVYSKLRVSMWLGPHKLIDESYGTLALPYVPFWGYREDRSRVPYGAVRDMIPIQDEISARRRKLLWMLSSKRVMVDSDALDTQYNNFDDLVDEINRPDSMIVLNPQRANRTGSVSIDNDLGLATQQYNVLIEAQREIQEVVGVYNAQMGKESGAKSGVGIQSLVEQGTTNMGDLFDNYRFARTLVGQRLLEMIVQDMSGTEVEVLVGEEGRRKTIVLNKPVMDSMTGIEYRENDVSKALVKVALSDVPSTPAYRQQTMTMLAEVIKGLPPQLQSPLVPYFLEASEHPKRREMADTVRKVLGLSDGPEDPRIAELQQALEQMQAAMQQGVEQYEGQIDDLNQKLRIAAVDLRNKEGSLAIEAGKLELKLRELEIAEAEEMREAEASGYSNQERAANVQRIREEVRRIRAEILQMAARTEQASRQAATNQMPARVPSPRAGGEAGL